MIFLETSLAKVQIADCHLGHYAQPSNIKVNSAITNYSKTNFSYELVSTKKCD